MLEELYPQAYRRYSSLPVLGSTLDGFTRFLFQVGYPRKIVRRHIQTAWHVDRQLQEQGCRSFGDVRLEDVRACLPVPVRTSREIDMASTVRLLVRFLTEHEGLRPLTDEDAVDPNLIEYAAFLRTVRGLADVTITRYVATASRVLIHCRERTSGGVANLTMNVVEDFVAVTTGRLSRDGIRRLVGELRSFLRFLAVRGQLPPGLDCQFDTPRVYCEEKLPRSLPWETVQALLQAIDRQTPMGRRDYAMLLLMATYGLRACDVAALRIDDIDWRASRLHVVQRKTESPLWLPMTDSVGDSLLSYLRDGRPPILAREVFVRHRAPAGILKSTAVTDVFQAWSRRSGLTIPFQGAHCLRHSYAVHLLRQGTPLKTIGDILGHRSAESTCVYLRLAVEDLREVALDLPNRGAGEVRGWARQRLSDPPSRGSSPGSSHSSRRWVGTTHWSGRFWSTWMPSCRRARLISPRRVSRSGVERGSI